MKASKEGASVKVYGSGTVLVYQYTDGGKIFNELKYVAYAPESTANLISVPKA